MVNIVAIIGICSFAFAWQYRQQGLGTRNSVIAALDMISYPVLVPIFIPEKGRADWCAEQCNVCHPGPKTLLDFIG